MVVWLISKCLPFWWVEICNLFNHVGIDTICNNNWVKRDSWFMKCVIKLLRSFQRKEGKGQCGKKKRTRTCHTSAMALTTKFISSAYQEWAINMTPNAESSWSRAEPSRGNTTLGTRCKTTAAHMTPSSLYFLIFGVRMLYQKQIHGMNYIVNY